MRRVAAAVVAGLLIETVPLLVASILEPPWGWAIAPAGFVFAWAAYAGGRGVDGAPDLARGVRALPAVARDLLEAYSLAMLLVVTSFIVAWLVVGTVVNGNAGAVIAAAVAVTILARYAYIVPCLAEGDSFGVAAERGTLLGGVRWPLAHAGILALVVAGLGPPAMAGLLSPSPPSVVSFAVVLGLLATTGPILMLGLEGLRPALEAALQREDSRYGRA